MPREPRLVRVSDFAAGIMLNRINPAGDNNNNPLYPAHLAPARRAPAPRPLSEDRE